MDHVRQGGDQVAGGRMVEAHRSADQGGRRAAAAVTQDLVAVADLLALEVEDSGRRRSVLAGQDVPLAVRDEREVPRPEPAGVGVPGLEQHAPRGDDVEPHVCGHRRQRQTPRRGELGAAVEGAVHPEEVQRLAERIQGRERVDRVHTDSMRASAPIIQ